QSPGIDDLSDPLWSQRSSGGEGDVSPCLQPVKFLWRQIPMATMILRGTNKMRVIGTPFATSTGLELVEIDHGQTAPHRRTLEADRALATPTQTAPPPLPRPQAHRRPQSPDRHPLRSENRHQLGGPASGDGLRLRHDLLEEAPRLEPGRG